MYDTNQTQRQALQQGTDRRLTEQGRKEQELYARAMASDGSNDGQASNDTEEVMRNAVAVTRGFRVPRYLAEKKLAIQQAITPEMVLDALEDLRQIALNDPSGATKVLAWREWLDRVMGKPQKEIFKEIQELKIEASAAELAQLSDEQLRQIDAIISEPKQIGYQSRAMQAESEELST